MKSSVEPAAASSRPNTGLRRTVATVLVVAAVLGAIVGYAVVGFAFTATLIGGADRTLDNVVSHQNSLNKSFNDVNSTFTALSSSSTYNPTQAKAAVDQWLAGSRSAALTIDHDDQALVSASHGLGQLPWLTALSRSSLDRETRRISHARLALSSARTVAADYMQDGQFWEAFIKSAQDFEGAITAAGAGDWAAARTAVDQMTADVNTALQMSGAPGLPVELKSAMTDWQSLATDYGKLVDASRAGDDAAVATASSAVGADANTLSAYNYDKINTEITDYYKPLIDRFNAEMANATS
ncbi:MAG TPA: hypothetical protein VJT78_07760 [Candidatus Dormibacteraeota bacterium]|nr:hypothetical protein [Candidatus Dormibacteraeota bacterium]